MAAKKKVKKKTTAKKSKSKVMMSMADFEKQMEAQAVDDSARVEGFGGGQYISISGSTFTLGDADLGDEVTAIIVDFANEKCWYNSVYDSDNPGSPACWAIGVEKPDELVPSDLSPVAQCNECINCEKSEWGSADTGRGKACSDKRRLMVVGLDELMEAESIEEVEVAMMKAPPSSISHFDKYIKGLGKVHKRPCYGVTTTMTFDDEFDFPVINFSLDEVISDANVLSRIMELRELCSENMLMEFDPDSYESPEDKKPKRKSKKKGKKKSKKKSKFKKK